jgi:hypothetical protein
VTLRDQPIPELLVVVRLGSVTLADRALDRSVATRRLLLQANGPELVAAGFALLPTLDHPHWTVVLSAPTAEHFEAVRRVFRGPIRNPAWTGRG